MLKFFRAIRKKLIEEDNVRKYLLYAIGEILLVVIGILIALQVNNWNEGRQNRIVEEQYFRSLMTDLEQDSLLLYSEVEAYNEELVELSSYIQRMSTDEVTIDTVIQIARYEFLPFFNPSNELNRNTITTLLSTGDLNLFDEETKNMIVTHNSLQLNELKLLDKNVDIVLEDMRANRNVGPSQNEVLYGVTIRGDLLNRIWESYSEEEILRSVTNQIQAKTINRIIMRSSKQRILDGTRDLMNFLTAEYPHVLSPDNR